MFSRSAARICTAATARSSAKIEEIYLDTDSNQPEWALATTGLFGIKQSFVPLGGMSQEGGTATVPYDKATVKDAPSVDPDGRLSGRSSTATTAVTTARPARRARATTATSAIATGRRPRTRSATT